MIAVNPKPSSSHNMLQCPHIAVVYMLWLQVYQKRLFEVPVPQKAVISKQKSQVTLPHAERRCSLASHSAVFWLTAASKCCLKPYLIAAGVILLHERNGARNRLVLGNCWHVREYARRRVTRPLYMLDGNVRSCCAYLPYRNRCMVAWHHVSACL